MRGYEIARKLAYVDRQNKPFIKWWRNENDFADIEEVTVFLENLNPDHEFAGFDLMSIDEMWAELKRAEPKRVSLGRVKGEPVIRWQHKGADGMLREDIYPYNAHNLMVIFDAETRGNMLC